VKTENGISHTCKHVISDITCDGVPEPGACDGGIQFINSASGLIQSPNFPSNYGNSMDCFWAISVPGKIKLLIIQLIDYSID